MAHGIYNIPVHTKILLYACDSAKVVTKRISDITTQIYRCCNARLNRQEYVPIATEARGILEVAGAVFFIGCGVADHIIGIPKQTYPIGFHGSASIYIGYLILKESLCKTSNISLALLAYYYFR